MHMTCMQQHAAGIQMTPAAQLNVVFRSKSRQSLAARKSFQQRQQGLQVLSSHALTLSRSFTHSQSLALTHCHLFTLTNSYYISRLFKPLRQCYQNKVACSKAHRSYSL